MTRLGSDFSGCPKTMIWKPAVGDTNLNILLGLLLFVFGDLLSSCRDYISYSSGQMLFAWTMGWFKKNVFETSCNIHL